MKYIAYYGAWGTSILCLGLWIAKMIVLIVNFDYAYDMTVARLEVLTMVILPFISIISAWIVCDMKKRMKDL
jgi:hypothetical protein